MGVCGEQSGTVTVFLGVCGGQSGTVTVCVGVCGGEIGNFTRFCGGLWRTESHSNRFVVDRVAL